MAAGHRGRGFLVNNGRALTATNREDRLIGRGALWLVVRVVGPGERLGVARVADDVHHREDFAAERIDDDAAAAGAVAIFDTFLELLGGHALDFHVDGELDVVACAGGLDTGGGDPDRVAAGVADEVGVALVALELVLEHELGAGHAGVVGGDLADDGGDLVAAGVLADLELFEGDAGDLEGADGAGLLVGEDAADGEVAELVLLLLDDRDVVVAD